MASPTAVSIKLVFPTFRNVDDAQVEFAIAEASAGVGSTWPSTTDRDIAWAYLAAHYLMVYAQRAATGQQIASERIGEISVSYVQPVQPNKDDTSDLRTTMYGLRYLDLCTKNFPPVMVV